MNHVTCEYLDKNDSPPVGKFMCFVTNILPCAVRCFQFVI